MLLILDYLHYDLEEQWVEIKWENNFLVWIGGFVISTPQTKKKKPTHKKQT